MSEENKPNAFVAVSIIGTFIILAVIISQSIEGRLSKSDEHAHHSVLDTISKTMERKEENTSALSYSRDIRKDGAKIRTLKEFYSRRAYPGAPPVIPHAVEKDGIIADRCLTCHENGGYVQSFKAYAPVSPHPEKENCRQCHVPVVEKELFVKVRSTGRLIKAKINIKNTSAIVNLLEEEHGIAPGQACVFYLKNQQGYKVLGGGWIKE